jgi:hypothetical protein
MSGFPDQAKVTTSFFAPLENCGTSSEYNPYEAPMGRIFAHVQKREFEKTSQMSTHN